MLFLLLSCSNTMFCYKVKGLDKVIAELKTKEDALTLLRDNSYITMEHIFDIEVLEHLSNLLQKDFIKEISFYVRILQVNSGFTLLEKSSEKLVHQYFEMSREKVLDKVFLENIAYFIVTVCDVVNVNSLANIEKLYIIFKECNKNFQYLSSVFPKIEEIKLKIKDYISQVSDLQLKIFILKSVNRIFTLDELYFFVFDKFHAFSQGLDYFLNLKLEELKEGNILDFIGDILDIDDFSNIYNQLLEQGKGREFSTFVKRVVGCEALENYKKRLVALLDRQSDFPERLLKVVEQIDLEILDVFLEKYNNPKFDFKVLLEGIKVNRVDVIKLLLDKRVNLVDNINDTLKKAVSNAAANGYKDIVEILINNGLKQNWKNAVWLAVRNNQIEMVKMFIEQGVDVNCRYRDNNTLLIVAVEKNYVEIARILVKNGADIFAKNDQGVSAFQTTNIDIKRILDDKAYRIKKFFFSVTEGSIEAIDHFINSGMNVNVKDQDGRTALFIAAQEGNLPLVKHLIELGASIKEKDNQDMTPFMEAVKNGNKLVVKFLLDFEDNFNCRNIFGHTLLMLAAHAADAEVLKIIIDKNVDVNIEDKKGYTPLILAIINDKVEIVKILLESGANPNYKTKFAYFPLMLAVHKGFTEIVKELIAKGADIKIEDENGISPLVIASKHGFIDIVNLFISNVDFKNLSSDDIYTALTVASGSGHAKIVESLSKLKILPIHKGCTTPLIAASQKGHLEVVEILLQSSLAIDAKDEEGYTALICAIENNHDKIVEKLLEAGASICDLAITIAKKSKNSKILKLLNK